jgi:opacity protein-like surface antigen
VEAAADRQAASRVTVESVGLSVWGEYEFQSLGESGFGSRVRPFIGAGVGVGFLSGDDVAGVTTGGGAYDLELEGDTELIPGAVAGVRIDLNDHLILELGARYDYHITDLEVTDNVTGRSEDVDDYDTFGGYVGLQFRW